MRIISVGDVGVSKIIASGDCGNEYCGSFSSSSCSTLSFSLIVGSSLPSSSSSLSASSGIRRSDRIGAIIEDGDDGGSNGTLLL